MWKTEPSVCLVQEHDPVACHHICWVGELYQHTSFLKVVGYLLSFLLSCWCYVNNSLALPQYEESEVQRARWGCSMQSVWYIWSLTLLISLERIKRTFHNVDFCLICFVNSVCVIKLAVVTGYPCTGRYKFSLEVRVNKPNRYICSWQWCLVK